MNVFIPRRIAPGSWLHEPRFKWFRDGYAYAETQTRAIPALAKCEPEELHAALTAILRGAGLVDVDGPDPQVYAALEGIVPEPVRLVAPEEDDGA